MFWMMTTLLVLLSGGGLTRGGDGEITMLVIPSVSPDASAASLEFRLRYDGADPIRASVGNLPGERLFHFVSLRAERFAIYGADPFVSCPRPRKRIFIDEPGVGYKVVNPGQVLPQTIDLFRLYDNLGEILGKCDLVLYWTHKLEIEGGFTAPRLAGAIVFPAALDIISSSEAAGRISVK